jgi:diketogulonate reductase-like aldo/keto reductase
MSGFSSTPVGNHTLSNGVEIPMVGFGCAFGNWNEEDKSSFFGFQPDLGYFAIPAALRAGYTHFDAAFVYGTHRILGSSLGAEMTKGTKSRKDFFVTTKVFHPPGGIALNKIGKTFDFSDPKVTDNIKERVLYDFERSLDELSFGYVDLLLMHWPGEFNTTDEAVGRERRKQCWEAMEEIYASGRARAIGVSNFQISHLNTLMQDANVKPMVNQIEISPFIQQQELVQYCQKNDIHPVAWAPFGSGQTGVLQDPVIAALASKYKKNVGQVILRWLIQQNISVLPKSSSESRMRSNLDVFDFSLSEEEVNSLNSLDRNATSVGASSHDIA